MSELIPQNPRGPKRRAPGPKGHWFFGNYFQHLNEPFQLYQQSQREFGDVVRFRFGPAVGHAIYHPDLVSHVLQKNFREYQRSRGHDILAYILGEGLLTTNGEKWQRDRKDLQPEFMTKPLLALTPEMAKSVKTHVRKWLTSADSGEARLANDDFMDLTIDVSSKLLFGVDIGNHVSRVREALQLTNADIARRVLIPLSAPLWMPTARNRRFLNGRRLVSSTIRDAVAKHPESARRGLLWPAIDRIQKIPIRPIRERAFDGMTMTFFVAASDTTAMSLAWTFYLLTQHPEAQEKICEEAHRVLGPAGALGSDSSAITSEQLESLEYTEQVVKEALRLYPPVWSYSRTVARDDELNGYHIARGSELLVVPYVMHRDPRFWLEPERFMPERFAADHAFKRPVLSYIPFSAGPRQCIGFKFAQMEAILATALTMREAKVRLPAGDSVTPKMKFLLSPEKPLRLEFSRR